MLSSQSFLDYQLFGRPPPHQASLSPGAARVLAAARGHEQGATCGTAAKARHWDCSTPHECPEAQGSTISLLLPKLLEPKLLDPEQSSRVLKLFFFGKRIEGPPSFLFRNNKGNRRTNVFEKDGGRTGSRESNLTSVSTRTRYLHAGVYTKRLKVPSLKQAGGQGLTAPHCRCSHTKRAERFTVALCETESGALSKSHVQIWNVFWVGVSMLCSTGCALFCSKRSCNYPDNEVYRHVV